MNNNAPKTRWVKFIMGSVARQRLFVNDTETPFFIDEAIYSSGKSCGNKYGLYGSGMHKSGCAAEIDSRSVIAPLKSKAERMAFEKLGV